MAYGAILLNNHCFISFLERHLLYNHQLYNNFGWVSTIDLYYLVVKGLVLYVLNLVFWFVHYDFLNLSVISSWLNHLYYRKNMYDCNDFLFLLAMIHVLHRQHECLCNVYGLRVAIYLLYCCRPKYVYHTLHRHTVILFLYYQYRLHHHPKFFLNPNMEPMR